MKTPHYYFLILIAFLFLYTEVPASSKKKYAIKNSHTIVQIDSYGHIVTKSSTGSLDCKLAGIVAEKFEKAGIKTVTRSVSGINTVKNVLEESMDEDYLDGNAVHARQTGATNIIRIETIAIEMGQSTYWYLLIQDYDISTGEIDLGSISLNNEGKSINESTAYSDAVNYIDHFLFSHIYGKLIMTSFDKKNIIMYPDEGIGAFGDNKLVLFIEKDGGFEYLDSIDPKRIKKDGAKYLVPINNKWPVSTSKIIGVFSDEKLIPISSCSYSINSSDLDLSSLIMLTLKTAFGEYGRVRLKDDNDSEFQKERELQKSESYLDGSVVNESFTQSRYDINITNLKNINNIVHFHLIVKDGDVEMMSTQIECNVNNLKETFNKLIINILT